MTNTAPHLMQVELTDYKQGISLPLGMLPGAAGDAIKAHAEAVDRWRTAHIAHTATITPDEIAKAEAADAATTKAAVVAGDEELPEEAALAALNDRARLEWRKAVAARSLLEDAYRDLQNTLCAAVPDWTKALDAERGDAEARLADACEEVAQCLARIDLIDGRRKYAAMLDRFASGDSPVFPNSSPVALAAPRDVGLETAGQVLDKLRRYGRPASYAGGTVAQPPYGS